MTILSLRLGSAAFAACILFATACGSDDPASPPQPDAAGPPDASTTADAPTAECQRGVVAGDAVVWIGDSYPDSGNGGIQRYAEERLRTAGALDADEHYRRYYQGGTRMANGEIPGQYDDAKQENAAIDTVIMIGGGNDILIGNPACVNDPPPGNQSCVDTVNEVVAAVRALATKLQTDGVAHVVYYFYPRTPLGRSKESVDYAAPLAKAVCEEFVSPLRCHFIDTRDSFEGHAEYFQVDGIHPTDAGQRVIGELIAGTMSSDCIAQ